MVCVCVFFSPCPQGVTVAKSDCWFLFPHFSFLAIEVPTFSQSVQKAKLPKKAFLA